MSVPAGFPPPHGAATQGVGQQTRPGPVRYPGGERPDLSRCFSETLRDLGDNIGGYALAGLGLVCAVIPLVLVLYLVIGGVVVGFVLLSASSGAGGLGPTEMLAGFGIYMLAILLVITLMNIALAPLQASLLRAVAAHQRGERPLGFGAAFSTLTTDAGRAIGVMLSIGLLVAAGALFCYLPGLLVAWLLSLALPLAVLHRQPVGRALSLSYQTVRADPTWHLAFFGIVFGMAIVGGNIPVIGPMVPLAFLVRVYRELAGDGDEPALAPPNP